jgi:hypothetical protein
LSSRRMFGLTRLEHACRRRSARAEAQPTAPHKPLFRRLPVAADDNEARHHPGRLRHHPRRVSFPPAKGVSLQAAPTVGGRRRVGWSEAPTAGRSTAADHRQLPVVATKSSRCAGSRRRRAIAAARHGYVYTDEPRRTKEK